MDGGVLANTPTKPALSAIEVMHAEGPVRPGHAPGVPTRTLTKGGHPGRLRHDAYRGRRANGLLGALSGQGGRTYVEQIEEHNRRAAGRRGLAATSCTGTTPEELQDLADKIYAHYRRLRVWRAGRDLATWLTGKGDDGESSSMLPKGWSYERVRTEAQRAQEEWLRNNNDSLPYVPAQLPQSPEPAGWGWGVTGALGVAEAACECCASLVTALRTTDNGLRPS